MTDPPDTTPPEPLDEPTAGEPASGTIQRPVIVGLLVAVIAAVSGAAIAHVAWPGSSSPSGSNSPLRQFAGLQPQSGNGSSATTTSVAQRIDPGVVDIDTQIASGDNGGEAAGTGMVISPNGEVLTNNHVISEAAKITATDIGNGRTYAAHVVGYDASHDVAVLQLENASGLATVPLGDSSTVRAGQTVVTIGNAGGVGGTPSAAGGSVAGLNQSITAADDLSNTYEKLTGLIQIDGQLQPGDSGGPLVNAAGKVIGMDTAASSTFSFQGSNGAGFAIPINTALSIAKQITAGHGSGTIHIGATPMLGVLVAQNHSCSSFGGPIGGYNGALVCEALSGTPAAAAGLTEGDTIVELGGHTVGSASALVRVKDLYHPGDHVAVAWLDTGGGRHAAILRLGTGAAD
ncbi:MAG: S1C family serine protease [Solirubrobacteraceae bacterium]